MNASGGVPGLLRGLGISASGLTAQRRRLDTIAMNIANAETTRTAEGGPYRRRFIELVRAEAEPGAGPAPDPSRLGPIEVPKPGEAPFGEPSPQGVEVSRLVEDTNPGPRVYDPGHPDADADGFVEYPNVDIAQEMVSLMEARRAYEANATAFEAMKSMLQRALEI